MCIVYLLENKITTTEERIQWFEYILIPTTYDIQINLRAISVIEEKLSNPQVSVPIRHTVFTWIKISQLTPTLHVLVQNWPHD